MNKYIKKILSRIQTDSPKLLTRLKLFFINLKKKLIKNPKNTLFFTGLAACLAIIIFSAISPFFIDNSYKLGKAAALIPSADQKIGSKIQYNSKNNEFIFDNQLTTGPETIGQNSSKVTANLQKDGTKKISVTDVQNKVDFSLTPKFALESGKKLL